MFSQGFVSFLLSFFLSLSSYLLSLFFSFLLSLMILPLDGQCSNKYPYTFFYFCKISPLKCSKGMHTLSFIRYCHVTTQISLQQFILLSAMNENIYSFTSLPELKLSFVFIFVNFMGKI